MAWKKSHGETYIGAHFILKCMQRAEIKFIKSNAFNTPWYLLANICFQIINAHSTTSQEVAEM